MVAEDHADSKASAKAIYEVIKQRLLKTHPDNMLPLVYVLDSILKNVKGAYIPIVEADAETWLSTVHRQLAEPQKQKLQKVWRTWLDCQLFSPASLKIMGRSFDERASEQVTGAVSKVAGISRTVNIWNVCCGRCNYILSFSRKSRVVAVSCSRPSYGARCKVF